MLALSLAVSLFSPIVSFLKPLICFVQCPFKIFLEQGLVLGGGLQEVPESGLPDGIVCLGYWFYHGVEPEGFFWAWLGHLLSGLVFFELV